MKTIYRTLMSFLKKEDGPTAVEYAVMLSLIIVVCIAAITTLGSNANQAFSFVGSNITAPSQKRLKPGLRSMAVILASRATCGSVFALLSDPRGNIRSLQSPPGSVPLASSRLKTTGTGTPVTIPSPR
jgi:pilus assembly protein Flp/PilA